MKPPDNIQIPCPICHERIHVPFDTDGERVVKLRTNLEGLYAHVNDHVASNTDGE